MGIPGNYKFTNKKHPLQGMMSTVLGMISLSALLLCVYMTVTARQEVALKYGLVCVVALLMAVSGMVLGVLGRLKKDMYYFFPFLGMLLNAATIIFCGYLIYAGVNGV